jgi:hypothetical protein
MTSRWLLPPGARVRAADNGWEGQVVPTPSDYYEPGSIRNPSLMHVKWDVNGAVTPEWADTLTLIEEDTE